MSRPERILLVRSGRHLQVALECLRRTSPGCHVTVVATPSAAPVLAECGIDPADTPIYDARPQFEAWPFLTSGLYRRARRTQYDRVMVLWTAPDGAGAANVARTAWLLSPSGFDAITPDGAISTTHPLTMVRRECRSAAASIAVLVLLHTLLYIPARMVGCLRRARPAPRLT